MNRNLLGLMVLCLLAVTPRAKALVRTVNTLADHNDGACGADCTLREAIIASAANGDAVTFSVAGTITLTGGELLINKNVDIVGAGAVTVSGNNNSRVF